MLAKKSNYADTRENLHRLLDGKEVMHHLNPSLEFKVANLCAQETVVIPRIFFDPSIRLIFTLQGQTNLTIGGCDYQLQAGTEQSAAILPINEDELGNKKFYVHEHQHEVVIFIKKSFFYQGLPENTQDSDVERLFDQHLNIRYIKITPMIRQLLVSLSIYVGGSEIIHRLHNESIILALLAEVIKQFQHTIPKLDNGSLLQRIEHLVAMMDSAQATDWHIKKMAQMCNTNPTTLQYTFKNKYGMTIAAYRREKQLMRAHTALTRGANVKTAAEIAGYNDLKSFTQAFLRQYQQHPHQCKCT